MSLQAARISCRRCAVLAHVLLGGDSASSVKKYVGKGVMEAAEKATAADTKFYEARYRTLDALERVVYHPGATEDERQFAVQCLDACVACEYSAPEVSAMITARQESSQPH